MTEKDTTPTQGARPSTLRTHSQLPPPSLAFIKYFKDHALRTVRVLRMLRDNDLDITPGPGARSVRELIAHICEVHDYLRGLLEDPKPTLTPGRLVTDVSTANAAFRTLTASIAAVVSAAGRIPVGQWDELIEPLGAKMPRRSLAYSVIEHEVHHCGQLYVYARMAGKEPPSLYAPVDDTLLEQ